MVENLLINSLLFVVGSVIGSFLNVVIDRLPRGETILLSRSYCEHCKKRLGFWDLIPLFSYLYLGGRCRYCRKKIPLRLVFVEVLAGIIFIALYHYSTFYSLNFLMFLLTVIIVSCLFVIFIVDFEYGIIPDQVLIFLVSALVVFHLLVDISRFPAHLLSGIFSFLLFLSIFLISRGRGMGFGDVKFAFVIGLLLGLAGTFVALYLAFLTGGVVSLILIFLKKKKLHGDTIAFGPFLSLGSLISYFWGEKIITQFMRYF